MELTFKGAGVFNLKWPFWDFSRNRIIEGSNNFHHMRKYFFLPELLHFEIWKIHTFPKNELKHPSSSFFEKSYSNL